MSKGYIEISSHSQFEKVLKENNVVVADFYADWCGPCKAIAPLFLNLALQYTQPSKMAFVKVNTDAQSETSRAYGVSALPSFLFFHRGALKRTVRGADPNTLRRTIAEADGWKNEGRAGQYFTSPGQKLGDRGIKTGSDVGNAGGSVASQQQRQPRQLGDNGGISYWLQLLIKFVGLYLVSLFTARVLSWFLGRS